MKNIIFSELLRYRKLALISSIGYFLLLLIVDIVKDFSIYGPQVKIVLIDLPALACIAFAIYQFSSYQKPSQWTYLIHRPLSSFAIFTGLMLAAFILITIVFILPIVLFYLSKDLFSSLLIEWRHYYILLHCFGTLISFYLAASFAALHPKKIAFFVILIPIIVFGSNDIGFEIFAKQVLLNGVLIGACVSVFKPAIQNNPVKTLSIVSSVIPIHLGLYAFCALISYMVTSAVSTYSDPSIAKVTTQAKNEFLLSNINNLERYNYFQQQIKQEKIHWLNLSLSFKNQQVHYQPYMNDHTLKLIDEKRGKSWVFSHEEKLFRGTNTQGHEIGWLGSEGIATNNANISAAGKLNFIPAVNGDYVYGQKQIYQFDPLNSSLNLLFSLPEDERLHSKLSTTNVVSTLALSSDKQLYLFNKMELKLHSAIKPFAKIRLPSDLPKINNISIAEISGDYFIFSYARDLGLNVGSFGKGGWVNGFYSVAMVDSKGVVTQVKHGNLPSYLPDYYLYSSYLVSSGYALIEHAIKSFNKPYKINQHIPIRIILMMVIIWLIIAAITARLLKDSNKSLLEKAIWVATSATAGLPGLICCWSLSNWKNECLKDFIYAKGTEKASIILKE